MPVYEFTLIVEGPDLQEEGPLDALFDAGFDDATIGRVGTIQFLEFDREAESFAEAVLSTTVSLESAIPGVRVGHLEPDDLLTISEISDRVGRTRESVRLLISGERGPGGFPAPATHFRSRQRMWRWQEVAIWFAEALGEARFADGAGRSHFITAFNAGLKWRNVDEDLQRQIERRVI
ncbi:MAG: hypothetical protein ACRDWA_03065 [Acidimicrobiia bacterium]